jgi:sulfite exporter TauE/SafE/predicted transcriptional regulator YdeE/copper chaperone CopZ
MESGLKTKRLKIGGMTCTSCQNKIERKLRNTAGVKQAKVSYNEGTADITYDADIISLKDISAVINKLDYKVLNGNEHMESNTSRLIGIFIIVISLYILLQQFGILNLFVPSQLAQVNMSYGMLFIIGLITSVHCVAMCGGINLSQCITHNDDTTLMKSRFSTLRPTFLYNLGRIISYTAVGFIVGAIGSAITFSNTLQGIMKLVAGVFMVIMGINMLGIFPWLRRFNPRMPKIFANKIYKKKSGSKSPLIVGLLNGLMPCGPLQAMQIYALSTGNPFKGALSMLLFSLGTVPLMFGLGALSSVLSKKFAQKIMTIGAVLVVVLGLSMFSQGWSLSGFTLSGQNIGNAVNVQNNDTGVKIENGVQIINSTLSSGKYPNIAVKAGMPVKWIINAPDGSINGCNNRMIIKEYDIEYSFKRGENIIEFTPSETGKFQYLLGVNAEDYDDPSEKIMISEIPEATYAVFTTPPAAYENREFSKAIQGTWDYILYEWFPNSGYEIAPEKADFEYYDERCHDPLSSAMDIYIPIVKRK